MAEALTNADKCFAELTLPKRRLFQGRLVQQACERSIEQEIPFRLPDCFFTRVHLSNLADRGHFILLG